MIPRVFQNESDLKVQSDQRLQCMEEGLRVKRDLKAQAECEGLSLRSRSRQREQRVHGCRYGFN